MESKVIEYINHHLLADYLQKLTRVKIGKLVLFSAFPITGAANISDPHYFIRIQNPEVLSDLIRYASN